VIGFGGTRVAELVFMLLRPFPTASLLALGVLASSQAHAEGPQPQPPPQPYAAPLSQTTQPSYVPQSVALSGPMQLDADDEMRVPSGYTAVERTRRGPIIAGAVTFGTTYLLTALGASVANDVSAGSATPLFVPALGPFIQMGKDQSDTGRFFLAIDGAAQCAGLALLIYGLTSKKTVWMRNDLVVAPMISGSSAGAGVSGTF